MNKPEIIESSVKRFLDDEISFIQLICFWISLWLNLEIPNAEDGLVIHCLEATENVSAEMNWGCQCTDYWFLGLPYERLFGYVIFEDSNY